MEVLPGIHCFPSGQASGPGTYSPNVYLIASKRAALIDSGYPHAQVVQELLDNIKGFSVEYIFLTHNHFDHAGGAPAVKRATQAQVLAHPQEGATVDRAVANGDKLLLNYLELEVVHTPGHTPGHICLWLEAKKTLFSGDHILGLGTNVVQDMVSYMDSLRRLLRYPIEVICPGHGPVVRHAQAKIQELIRHREEREGQVLSCLRRGLSQIPAMVQELYPELSPNLIGSAQQQVRAHLEKLIKEGRARVEGGNYSSQ